MVSGFMFIIICCFKNWELKRPKKEQLVKNSHNNIPFRIAGICINDHETFYWYREEREKLLTGTGVVEAVNRDIKKILKEFQTVVSPYLKKHKGTIRWSFTDLFLNNTPFHPECVYSDLKQAVLEDSSHHKKKLIYFEKAELWLESIQYIEMKSIL